MYKPALRTDTGSKALIQLTACPTTISGLVKTNHTCTCINVSTILISIFSKSAKKFKLFSWLSATCCGSRAFISNLTFISWYPKTNLICPFGIHPACVQTEGVDWGTFHKSKQQTKSSWSRSSPVSSEQLLGVKDTCIRVFEAVACVWVNAAKPGYCFLAAPWCVKCTTLPLNVASFVWVLSVCIFSKLLQHFSQCGRLRLEMSPANGHCKVFIWIPHYVLYCAHLNVLALLANNDPVISCNDFEQESFKENGSWREVAGKSCKGGWWGLRGNSSARTAWLYIATLW